MADKNLTLGVQTDEATIANAKKRLQELEQAQLKLAYAQVKYANDSSKAGRAIREGIEKRSKELTNEQKRLARALRETNAALLEQQTAANRAAKGVEAAQAASVQRRGHTNPGGAGAEQLRTIGRDIRGLPSIRVPGIGIGTDTFGRAAEVLGRLGVTTGQVAAAAGPAIVAIAAIGVGFFEYTKRALQAREVQKAYTESLKETIDLLNSEKGTSEAVAEQQRELEQNIENAKEHAAALRDVREARNEENDFIEDLFTRSRVLAGGTRKQLNEDINAADVAVRQAEASLEAFNFALDEGEVAANDAAAAEKALAEARTAGVLREAEQAGELASLKARASELTQEQIDSELESLDIRKAALAAELAALEASGDESEEVAKKIAELREALGFLGEQADVLKIARPSAKSSEAEKAAEKAAKDAQKAEEDRLRDIEKVQNDAAKAQQSYTDSVRDAQQNFRDATADIARKLKDTFIDNQREFQDDLNEMSIKFNEDELKEERQFRRDLAKIRRDAADEEKDAIRQRDFAAAAAARENAEKALKDRREEEADENAEQLTELQQERHRRQRERDLANRDAQIDAQRARRDAAIARDRSIRDAQASYRDALQLQHNFSQQFVANMNTMFNNVLQAQNRALGGTTNRQSSTTSRIKRTTSRQSTANLDELQAILSSR